MAISTTTTAKSGINPAMLLWARTTACLELEEAAKKLKLAPELLAAIEHGDSPPPSGLLYGMELAYHCPRNIFYAYRPPPEGDLGADFRPTGHTVTPRADFLAKTLLSETKTRQSLATSLLEDDKKSKPVGFIGSLPNTCSAQQAAETISRDLGFNRDFYRQQGSALKAFEYLRECAEASGIFALLAGNLGDSDSKLEIGAIRGCALSSDIAPFVVVNRNDSHCAWSFTMLHLLCHLWRNESGRCYSSGLDNRLEEEDFCDEVVSWILLSPEEYAELKPLLGQGFKEIAKAIDSFATQRLISQKMVACDLRRLGIIDQATCSDLHDHLQSIWEQSPKQEITVDLQIERENAGEALISLARRMNYSGELSTNKAGIMLGIHPSLTRRLW